MKSLLLLLIILPLALSAQQNPSYDADFDGDGCYGVPDLMGFLTLFGSCPEQIETGAVCIPVTIDMGDSLFYGDRWYRITEMFGRRWFAENLSTTVFQNGDPIYEGFEATEWCELDGPGQKIYGNGDDEWGCYDWTSNAGFGFNACQDAESSLATYGRHYNGYAADDERNLCPVGWRLPTTTEFDALRDSIDQDPNWLALWEDSNVPSDNYAMMANCCWYNTGGNWGDPYGFSILPAGASQCSGSPTHAWGGRWCYLRLKDAAGGNSKYTKILPSGDDVNWSDYYSAGMSVRCIEEVE